MKHIFILQLNKEGTHPFIPTIHKVMKPYDYEVRISRYIGHAVKIIQEYHEPTRFYSVGGDGMNNQLLEALLYTDHEFVVIPYGTGNDFARKLYGKKDPEEILIQSLNKEVKVIDTVKANDKYFINSACFGIDALIANHVHDDSLIQKSSGRYGYIAGIVRQITGYPFYKMKVKEEDKVLFDGQVTICAMMNGGYYGGGFEIAPRAVLDDGLMEVMILPKINKWKAPYYITKILHHTLDQVSDVIYTRAKSLDVYTDAVSNLDGDAYQSAYYHLEVLPQSLKIIY